MHIIANEKTRAMLKLALAEKDENSRYTLLNAIAESLKTSECLSDRVFASVCYELNAEPYAASVNNTLSLTSLTFEDNFLFTNSCVLLQHKNIEKAKELFQKAITFFINQDDYSSLGMLIKIQKLLLQRIDFPEKDYFKDIELPQIVVIKSFTSALTEYFSEEQLELGKRAAIDLVGNVACVISCCTNIMEQQMLDVFISNGIKVSCVPSLPTAELFEKTDEETRSKIEYIYSKSDIHPPITEYTQASISGENVWNVTEEYSAKYLLGLAMLKREDTGLPISYIWSDFSNVFSSADIENICNQNEISAMKVGR